MASKLSGGTRRKLSLAIALVANPRVLLLDEPSSGMDPAAKRALWRTLAAGAAGRVLLLTTHSMEEADALCERAGIMAGRMLALGPTAELRDRFGRSVGVHLVHGSAPWTSDQDMRRMREWALGRWPEAEIERSAFGGQLRFNVPRPAGADGDALMGQLFRAIEEAKTELGVVDYAIGPATLDQVFLNVVGRHDVREENTEAGSRFSPGALFGGLGGLLGKV
jgi:ABC-type multidrug transport system ATPase subunit